jgi:hypothetical protein
LVIGYCQRQVVCCRTFSDNCCTEKDNKTVTRLHYTLIFTDAEEGKHIRIQGAWINPRIQNGPWSEEVRELIN